MPPELGHYGIILLLIEDRLSEATIVCGE